MRSKVAFCVHTRVNFAWAQSLRGYQFLPELRFILSLGIVRNDSRYQQLLLNTRRLQQLTSAGVHLSLRNVVASPRYML